jgi:SAM-dependent methyltransferase
MKGSDAVRQLDDRAQLDFILTLRKRWADTLYPALRAEYAAAVDPQSPPTSAAEAIPVVRQLPLYPWFSWTERGQQKMMWRAISAAVARSWPQLRAQMEDVPQSPIGSLRLDPDLALPHWYTAYDIHIQPGGVWSDDTSAFVYEEGAKIVMLRENDEYLFHRLLVDTAVPRRDYQRIVDVGCGFGKSTRPFAQAYPAAEVWGLDLAAPCLRLAHAQAERLGKAIHFTQADSRRTDFADCSVDLVTGTMVLHEMPPNAVKETIAEAARILRPGGVIRFLEFATTGDPFRDATVYEHGERNNEPFIPLLFDADVAGFCAAAGLKNVRWMPFDERGGGVETGWGERDEWHFPWAVLAAEKPE